MPIPVKSTCTPNNIFGPVSQHLFLGCSVVSFTTSIGFNGQTSECTVNLAVDTCESQSGKTYYDHELSRQSWNDPDPGFYGLSHDIIGHPVYFRFEDFEFSGIIQSWEKSISSSGEVYSVKIVDPTSILEHAHCIISSYAGGVSSTYNVFNCFGYAESFGVSCPEVYQSSPGVYEAGDSGPDGSIFGSPAGAYGGSDTNHSGMKTSHIIGALRLLTSSYPANTSVFSPYGRIISRGSSIVPAECMGLMDAATLGLMAYYLDLSELPATPSYFRENGISITVLDLVSKICTESGHDFFLELVPVVDGVLGPGIHKFIKLRTVNRNVAPALNSIDTFLANAGRKVISYNAGQELRNEVTSTIVIGGSKQNFYQVEQSNDPEDDGQPTPIEADDMIVPYFGINPSNGNVIIPTKDANEFWEFEAPTDDLALQLANPPYSRTIPSFITINEQELMNAKMGYDAWLSYASTNNTDLYAALGVQLRGIWDLEHLRLWVKNNPNLDLNKARAADFLFTAKNVFAMRADPNTWEIEVLHIAFAWLNKLVEECYGRKYQVRIPFTCARLDTDSNIKLLSEEPSEGGYTEVTPILGLAHPSIYTDMFLLPDNRLGSFSRFDNSDGLESANLNINEFISYNDQAWVKINVDPQFVFLNASTLASPRVVITLPQPIHHIQKPEPNVAELTKGLNELLRGIDGIKGPQAHDQVRNRLGSILLSYARANQAVVPDAVGFGIKSNVLTYGPWGSSGVPGGVNIVHDDSLVPWEYGGFSNLDTAGNQLASAGVTNTQVAEEGSITVAGFPNIPLGAELLASDAGGPFDGGGANLVENRSVSSGTYQATSFYYTNIYAWDGTFGPNVTGITVQVGEGGFSTTYSLRTWTPKFGRYAKYNADRLKTIGQNRMNWSKQLRALGLRQEQKLFVNRAGAIGAAIRTGNGIGKGRQDNLATPHEVLMGELTPWNSGIFDRTTVMSASMIDLGIDINQSGYENKAFMSLDGLIRPIQTSRVEDSNLPRFATPIWSDDCKITVSKNGLTPINSTANSDINGISDLVHYKIRHSIDYLNPFSNPVGFTGSEVLVAYGQNTGTEAGHDIEILGRGTGVPPSSIILPIEGYAESEDLSNSDYHNDYRALALRGPLVIHGWGFDLDGKPVPNVADVDCTGGIFTSTNLQDKFYENWLRKPKSWPVAPVDLRYDRHRAVWTVPQKQNYTVATNDHSDYALGISISGCVVNYPISFYDRNGDPISNFGTNYPNVPISPNGFLITQDNGRIVDPIGGGGGAVSVVEYNPTTCEYDVIGTNLDRISIGIFEGYPFEARSGIIATWDGHGTNPNMSMRANTLSSLVFGGGVRLVDHDSGPDDTGNKWGRREFFDFGIKVGGYNIPCTGQESEGIWHSFPYTSYPVHMDYTFLHQIEFGSGLGVRVEKWVDDLNPWNNKKAIIDIKIPVEVDSRCTGDNFHSSTTHGYFNYLKFDNCISGYLCGCELSVGIGNELSITTGSSLGFDNNATYYPVDISDLSPDVLNIPFISAITSTGVGNLRYKIGALVVKSCGLIESVHAVEDWFDITLFETEECPTGTG